MIRPPTSGRAVVPASPPEVVRGHGVDEHAWRHTRRGDKYVTVVIDLTGIRDGTGPARLLDMVEGRSKQAFKTWLADRDRDCSARGRDPDVSAGQIGQDVEGPAAVLDRGRKVGTHRGEGLSAGEGAH